MEKVNVTQDSYSLYLIDPFTWLCLLDTYTVLVNNCYKFLNSDSLCFYLHSLDLVAATCRQLTLHNTIPMKLNFITLGRLCTHISGQNSSLMQLNWSPTIYQIHLTLVAVVKTLPNMSCRSRSHQAPVPILYKTFQIFNDTQKPVLVQQKKRE